MGLPHFLATGVLDRKDTSWQASYRTWMFKVNKPAHVLWCGPQKEPLPEGFEDVASGTLRVKLPPKDEIEVEESYTSNPIAQLEPSVFRYQERLGYEVEGFALFHLALPPNHLPRPESIQPAPDYGWPHEDRFAIVWLRRPDTVFSLVFEEVPPVNFADRAALCSLTIQNLPKEGADNIVEAPVVRIQEPQELAMTGSLQLPLSTDSLPLKYIISNPSEGARQTITLTSEIKQFSYPYNDSVTLNPGEHKSVTQHLIFKQEELRKIIDTHKAVLHTKSICLRWGDGEKRQLFKQDYPIQLLAPSPSGGGKDRSDLPTVFISYSHEDGEVADKLKATLEKNGIVVRIDEAVMEPGANIQKFIESSIRNTDVTIAIISNRSLLSVWVAIEIIYTFDHERFTNNKKFIACYIDDDFRRYAFRSEATQQQIDVKIDEINKLIQEHNALKIDTNDLNCQKSRLQRLRNNLGDILLRLREGQCMDIREDKFDESVAKIVSAIKEKS